MRLPSLLYSVLALLFVGPAFAEIKQVSLQTSSSEQVNVYVAGPTDAAEAIVLVHDWFGVSPFYTEAAQRLADSGYRVLALDLYAGRRATTHEQAAALLGALQDDLAVRQIDAAIKAAAVGGRRVAVMGFSMGAKHALAGALRSNSVRATILWYGETIKDAESLRRLSGPVLLIVGSHDGPSAAESSLAFSKAADAAGVGAEVFVYPGAEHAFAQPLFNQGRTYDPAATRVAWQLSESFLKRRLH
jgi:carboxymethylenebutenolidase